MKLFNFESCLLAVMHSRSCDPKRRRSRYIGTLPAHSKTTKLSIHILLNVTLIASTIFPFTSLAQDPRELQQERQANAKLKGEHPLLELMRTRKSTLRPELMGVHPRVYVTDKELAELERAPRIANCGSVQSATCGHFVQIHHHRRPNCVDSRTMWGLQSHQSRR